MLRKIMLCILVGILCFTNITANTIYAQESQTSETSTEGINETQDSTDEVADVALDDQTTNEGEVDNSQSEGYYKNIDGTETDDTEAITNESDKVEPNNDLHSTRYIDLRLASSSVDIFYEGGKYKYRHNNEGIAYEFDPSSDIFVLKDTVNVDNSVNIKDFRGEKATLNFEFDNLNITNTFSSSNSSWNHHDSANYVNVNIRLKGNNSITVGSSRPAIQFPYGSIYTFVGEKDSTLTLDGDCSFAKNGDGEKAGEIFVEGYATFTDNSFYRSNFKNLNDKSYDQSWDEELKLKRGLMIDDWSCKKDEGNGIVTLNRYIKKIDNPSEKLSVTIPSKLKDDSGEYRVVVNKGIHGLFDGEQIDLLNSLTIGNDSNNPIELLVDGSALINNLTKLEKLEFNNVTFTFNNVQDISKLIDNCNALNYIDLSGLNSIGINENGSLITFNKDNKYIVITNNDNIKNSIKDKYTPYEIELTLNLDGGSNPNGVELKKDILGKDLYANKVDLDEEFKFGNIKPGNIPSKPGYKFNGWFNGDKELNNDYDFYKEDYPNSQIEIKAKWEAKPERKIELINNTTDFITYSGNAIELTRDSFTIEGSKVDGDFSLKWYEKAENDTWNEMQEKPVNAGSYKATVTLKEDDNYKETTKEFEFTISKAKNEWTEKINLDGWTYGETANEPSAKAAFGKVTFTYSEEENGTYTNEVPSNAGTYYVKATVLDTENYEGLEAIIAFTVKPLSVIDNKDIIIPTIDKDTDLDKLVIKCGDKQLVKDEDYKIEVKEDGDEAIVTISFYGNYSGNIIRTYKLDKTSGDKPSDSKPNDNKPIIVPNTSADKDIMNYSLVISGIVALAVIILSKRVIKKNK